MGMEIFLYVNDVVTFPLRAIMFTKEQLQIIEEEDLRILFMDATSSIIRKPQSLRCKKIFYYCQVFRLNGKIIPAAEMLTSEHETKSISYFLKEYKYFVLKETGSWPFFNAVVVDWSLPSIHSLLYEWNNMTITQYLDLMYSCAVEEKSPPNIKFILTCIAHVLHRVALAIDKNYSEYKPIKSFLLDLTSILFLCRDIWDLDMYYKDRLSLLLTKHGEKAEQSLLFLVGEIEKKRKKYNASKK